MSPPERFYDELPPRNNAAQLIFDGICAWAQEANVDRDGVSFEGLTFEFDDQGRRRVHPIVSYEGEHYVLGGKRLSKDVDATEIDRQTLVVTGPGGSETLDYVWAPLATATETDTYCYLKAQGTGGRADVLSIADYIKEMFQYSLFCENVFVYGPDDEGTFYVEVNEGLKRAAGISDE